jgi:XTP/dITP diphosphohydrolase
MKELLIASGNRHKIEEIRAILAPLNICVTAAGEKGDLPDVVEDGDTFEANAAKKALTIAKILGQVVLADDSGLEVRALDGAPGIFSARYAGEQGNDQANMDKLLQNLKGVSDRQACFRCVVVLAGPQGVLGTASGEVRGRIIDAPRGTNGFGYDPIFVPEGESQTFAELPEERKNGMSHRSAALQTALANRLFDLV